MNAPIIRGPSLSAGSFAGRVYVVTGCSRGVGRSLTSELLRRGAVVHGVARSEDVLEGMVKGFGGRFTYTSCDLSTDECVDRVVRDVEVLYGGVYGLINNAGAGALGNPLELGPAVIEGLTKLLYLSPVKLTLRLVPSMLRRGEGVVVNVISLGIVTHIDGLEAYLAPKHALHRFSKDLRRYLRGSGVKVITVYPSVIETRFFSDVGLRDFYLRFSSNPLSRWFVVRPEKVASEVMKAIEGGREVVAVPRAARILLLGR